MKILSFTHTHAFPKLWNTKEDILSFFCLFLSMHWQCGTLTSIVKTAKTFLKISLFVLSEKNERFEGSWWQNCILGDVQL